LVEQNTYYNLTWVNCEMGSFIMMSPGKENGTVVQSLDVLDFSVIHLSAFERLQRRWWKLLGKHSNINSVLESTKLLQERAAIMRGVNNTTSIETPLMAPEMNRTVVIMPFLGADMGAGHSKLGNRFGFCIIYYNGSS